MNTVRTCMCASLCMYLLLPTTLLCCSCAAPPTASVPTLKDLSNRVAAVIPDKWIQVAIQLELDMSVIRTIRKEESSCFEQFVAVLEQWKKSSSLPYTWKSLVTVLRSRSVNESRLAHELEIEFCFI